MIYIVLCAPDASVYLVPCMPPEGITINFLANARLLLLKLELFMLEPILLQSVAAKHLDIMQPLVPVYQLPAGKNKRRRVGKQKPVPTRAPRTTLPSHVSMFPGQSTVQSDFLQKIERRVGDLEVVVYKQHDQQLRSLDQWSTHGWKMPLSSELATRLAAKLEEWKSIRPRKGPHEWGPPRRCLTAELIQFFHSKLDKDKAFVKFHQTIPKVGELEVVSVNYLMARKKLSRVSFY